jgi:hypothetical protein
MGRGGQRGLGMVHLWRWSLGYMRRRLYTRYILMVVFRRGQRALVSLLKGTMACAFSPLFQSRPSMLKGQRCLAQPFLASCSVCYRQGKYWCMGIVSTWWDCWTNNICLRMLLWSVVSICVVICYATTCLCLNGSLGFIMGAVMLWHAKLLGTRRFLSLWMVYLKKFVWPSIKLLSPFLCNSDNVFDAPVLSYAF